jgi:formylglycine-generating enzyme required for sulfatase activity
MRKPIKNFKIFEQGIIIVVLICGIASQSFADVLFSTSAPPRQIKSISVVSPPSSPVDDGVVAKKDFSLPLGTNVTIDFVWLKQINMWVSKYEITNEQYERFNPNHQILPYYSRTFDESNQPVVFVSWDDANSFCSWLNKKYMNRIPPGYVFRLPVEKEWEQYALCGKNKRFPWGNDWPPPDSFNYCGEEGNGFFYTLFERETHYIKEHRDGFVVAAPVKQSGKNEWGLYGVGGNVWEWCLDWFDEEKLAKSLRGASWYNWQQEIIAITNRSSCFPHKSNAMIGFRVVIAPPPLIDY